MLHLKLTGVLRRRCKLRGTFAALVLIYSFSLLMISGAVAQQRSSGDNRQNAAVTPNLFSAAPYVVGERLTYSVSFATYPAAAFIELAVANRTRIADREAIELQAHIETLGVVNAALYAANNDYRAFVDPLTGVPFRTQIITREGARTEDASRDYNQPAGTNAIPARTTRVSVAGTYDMLAALYRARALPLAPGATYRFQIVAGRTATETYDVELRVTGRELTKTSVGSYNTLVATARIRNEKSYTTRINFTDDERHVPVLVRVDHPAGEIRAELASSALPAAPPTQAQVATLPLTDRMPTPNVPPQTDPVRPPRGTPFTDNSNPASSAAAPLTPKTGDELNFNVFLGASTQAIGAISFDVRGRGTYFNRDALLITATARTTGNGARLFPVNDRIASYLDPVSLLPFRSEQQLQEGARRLNRALNFEQERGRVVREDNLRTEIPSGTHDLVSLVYALRRFDLTPPRRTSVAIFTSNRAHTLAITALSREQIQLGGETLPAVQLALTTDAREPDRNAYRLWISDDARRLPLRFTMQTPLGSVRADLAIIPGVRQ